MEHGKLIETKLQIESQNKRGLYREIGVKQFGYLILVVEFGMHMN